MTASRPPRPSTMTQLAPYMGLGLQLAAAMVFFGAIGYWADSRLGTEPWLLVVGLLLGSAGGMISIIRTTIRSSPKKPPPAAAQQDSSDPGA